MTSFSLTFSENGVFVCMFLFSIVRTIKHRKSKKVDQLFVCMYLWSGPYMYENGYGLDCVLCFLGRAF